MSILKYLTVYPDEVNGQVRQLIVQGRLDQMLLQKYPATHGVRTDSALYD